MSNIKLISPNVKVVKSKKNRQNLLPSPDTSERGMVKRIKSKEKEKPKSYTRNDSINNSVDNKKKDIEKMDSNIRRVLEQANTQDEIQSFTQNYYGNYNPAEKVSYNYGIKKYNYSSNDASVSAINSQNMSILGNSIIMLIFKDNLKENDLDSTPQFKSKEDGKRLYAIVTKDFFATQV